MKAMPLPRSVARFNRRATNRLLGPLVPYLPTFCFVIHTGRKTGRQYRTAVNGLRLGLVDTDIEVCTVYPASSDTPFCNHAANSSGREVEPLGSVDKPEKE